MKKYHMNFEGKIYPCKAKVMKCPYGDDFHADNKVELYYKLMGSMGVDAETPKPALDDLQEMNRLKSLYSISNEIEKVDYPVDVIVTTLKETLVHLEKKETKAKIVQDYKMSNEVAEKVRLLYLQGETVIPDYVPASIRAKGYNLFQEKDHGKSLILSKEEKEERIADIKRELAPHRQHLEHYGEYEKWGLKSDNYQSTYAWVSKDFEKFSHDLNTSKMITQPVFYGDLDRAREAIKHMDNYELLATFDDYSVTDEEIERNVKEANHFNYEWRKDLTDEANSKLELWYNRNKEIYKNWKVNTPKRVLLSIEIAKELDKRTVLRQDAAVGEMLAKGVNQNKEE